MKQNKILILFFLIVSNIIQAQDAAVLNNFEFPGFFSCRTIEKDNNNNFYLGGALDQNALIIKFDLKGDTIWSIKTGTEKTDAVYDISQITNNEFIAVGRTNYYMDDHNYLFGELLVFKFTNDGDIIWEKHLGGERNDEGYNVIPCKNGGLLVCGIYGNYSPNSNGDFWLLKLDNSGNTLWSKTYHFSVYNRADNVFEDENGNIYLIGNGIKLLKLDNLGNVLDEFEIDGRYAIHTIKINDSFIISGSDENELFLKGISQLGEHKWQHNFDTDLSINILPTSSNTIILSGLNNNKRTLTIKEYSEDGDLYKQYFTRLNNNYKHYNVIQANNEALLFFGSSNIDGKGNLDILKLDYKLSIQKNTSNEFHLKVISSDESISFHPIENKFIPFKCEIYNYNGQLIELLEFDTCQPQYIEANTGIYIYRIITSGKVNKTGKIMIH